jgi:hypothetical protein
MTIKDKDVNINKSEIIKKKQDLSIDFSKKKKN